MVGVIRYTSPAEIRELLGAHGLALSKRFGQNFLINQHAQQRLVAEALAEKPQNIWEIGPGIGTLSHALSNSCASFTMFEIDNGFVRLLQKEFAEQSHVRIVSGDFIDTWRVVAETESQISGC